MCCCARPDFSSCFVARRGEGPSPQPEQIEAKRRWTERSEVNRRQRTRDRSDTRNAGYLAHLSEWGHRFTRFFAATRSALRERINLLAMLKIYATASRRMRGFGALQDASLPGFEPSRKESHGTASVPQLSLARACSEKTAIDPTEKLPEKHNQIRPSLASAQTYGMAVTFLSKV